MDLSRIGPFALEGKLGGAKSSVYRAVHVEKRLTVAVKVFDAPLVASGSAAQTEFMKEFDLLKRLQHPNLIRCYGGGFEGNKGYLATEIVQGESLDQVIKRRGRIPWELVVETALRVAAGLEHAHQSDFCHEELTPDKILTSESGQLKIGDFRVRRSNDPNYFTPTAPAKAAYLSPEHFSHKPVTSKSDLYCLGCIMYHMITGHPPFDSSQPSEIVQGHLEQTPPRVATEVLECPVWLDALIAQLLEKNPNDRPHSAATVSLALEETKKRVAAGTGVAEHATSGLSPIQMNTDRDEAAKVLGRKKRKKKRDDAEAFYEQAWFLAICLFLVAGGLAAFLFWPPSQASLIAKADKLMASENSLDWHNARMWYLEPLLKRYPDGEFAVRAQEHIDFIDMQRAESKSRFNERHGRDPRSEGERQYRQARRYEKFGDLETAKDRYKSMVKLLQDEESERPFLNLAKRQIAKIERENAGDQRKDFIEKKIRAAKDLVSSGKRIEANEILSSIVTLYKDNKQLESLVLRAQASLQAGLNPKKKDEKKEDKKKDRKTTDMKIDPAQK